ncbi:MAG: Nuclear import receptor [Watsoniomyces obsoletus]|nr:MAG: Nuclear import receptor [Watsoniomyces obsoletus]
MAANGGTGSPFDPVLAAVSTLQKNVERAEKEEAHRYLEQFQKSPEAWTATFALLQSSDVSTEAKLFAATTLKGKINYDFDQLPRSSLPALRDSLLSLLASYATGPRPIRIQLCICLANLALQMLEWKDVLEMTGSKLGGNPQTAVCMLEFLRVLPEEITEGRKISLSEDELAARTMQLIDNNASQVLHLLDQYSRTSPAAANNPLLLECLTSWLREVPLSDVVASPLLGVVVGALSYDASFEAAVDCLCAIFKESKEVDEYLTPIQTLYPRIVALKPRIAQAAKTHDEDIFRGLTRIFAEAGEAWVVLIARMPREFRTLVECVLECAAQDQSREAISLTFNFWYEMKIYLVLEKYIEARMQFADVFARLVDIMIKHLEFPVPDDGDESDLFDGDREQEEKFRESRHLTGDVLKDCCEVIGVTECLGKSFKLIQDWIARYAGQVTATTVPHWQSLEAPLFSLRAMGRVVDKEENIILPQLMPLLIQVPNHPRVRFTAIMTLGRYTEWTSEHPELLEPQFKFIISSFETGSKDIMTAAALALKFFCQDCRALLKDHVVQLQKFYDSVLDSLPQTSQEEVSEGVANVVAIQPVEKVYDYLKLYCDPLVKRLMSKANEAHDDTSKLRVADHLQLLTVFVQSVVPYVEPNKPNPAVKYWQEIFPVLSALVDNFLNHAPICERVCRFWRSMVLSYRTATQPVLPVLADKLVSSFAASRHGCFLWATDAIVREFSEGTEFVDPATTEAIYQFFEAQALTVLRALNVLPPTDLPDVIEDFFRLLVDALIYYPHKFISSNLFAPIFSAALTALTLEQADPLTATLHFLRDLLAYGGENSPIADPTANANLQPTVQKLILTQGELLVQRVLVGMMFSFPKDCFPDASGILLDLVNLVPSEISVWIAKTIQMLPAGTVNTGEAQRLLNQINQRLAEGETRKVRYLLQDFTNSYRRRNVAPREGLGRLEATRFRFSG